jgi:superfamily II RNA helicase
MPEAGTRAAPESFRLGDRVTHVGRLAPEQVLDRFLDWLAQTGLQPYPAQEQAFLELMAGRHVVLSTPTGSGKSLVALLAHFKTLCEGGRSFYTAPTKALASEKFFALCAELGPECVGMLTGDASINPDAPVICCTAEVLANIALRRGEQAAIPCVVMDEFHYYADVERGVAWQTPLLLLPRTQFLLMSATLGDMSAIAEDLQRRSGRAVAIVHNEQRPVPLDFEYRETPLHETVERLLESDRAPIYLVSFTQREAAELAGALCSAPISDRALRRRIREAVSGFRFDTPYGREMQRLIAAGVGVHHAGLLPKYRLLVEQLSQAGLLRVISGTDTLGVGVNIPIRTVLFTGLAKFDGRRVGLLSVREFKQIAGRAGRKGFDERGSVVCQAPEHVVEAKRRARAGKRPGSARRPVSWNRSTFEGLIRRPPEPLVSRFRVSHDMAVAVLRREQHARGGGYRELVELIDASHSSAARKRSLRRQAAQVFRALRRGGIVALQPEEGGPTRGARAGRRVRIDQDLQWNFSLLHNLSLYLVDALACLDRSAPGYALEALSLVESILEDPRAVLQAQVERIRREVLAQLKADGVPYEERVRLLEEVTHPQPGAELIEQTFAIFREHHPWVGGDDVRPKSVARELYESGQGFNDYVRAYSLQRCEGVLLRYLGQVYTTLVQCVPEAAKTDELDEIEAWLRALLERVDDSLTQEWESLLRPARAGPQGGAAAAAAYDLARDERGLRARVRAELRALVGALAAGEHEEAAGLLRPDPAPDAPAWDAARLERAMAPLRAEHGAIAVDHRARLAEFTQLRRMGPRLWRATQQLLDRAGEPVGALECEIDLRGEPRPAGPLLRLLEIAAA